MFPPLFVPSAMAIACCFAVVAKPPAAAAGADSRVVVRVNTVPIRAGEVQQLARLTLQRDLADTESDRRLFRLLAEELVTRELARQALLKSKWGVGWETALLECRRREDAWKEAGRSLEEYLRQQGIDRDAWQRQVHWQLAWKRYLEHFVTDDNLRSFFDKHRPHFDGGKRHVAHILIKPDSSSQDDIETARRKAVTLQRRLAAGELTFEQAAKQFSQSPSSATGGDLGWIERRQPMPESFSKAAFDLKVAQISDPVRTVFGFHLIRVLEEKPGKDTYQDARPELEKALRNYLLKWLSDREREKAEVEWTAGE